LEIEYQSLTRPEPATRVVQPKTLVFDGLRWHMRAYSLTHSDFRDFVLARIHSAVLQGKSKPSPPDTLWNTMLNVEVGPHPGLTENQKRVVERDYGMVDGRLTCSVRAALLPYWLLAMRIGKDDLQREALVQQIVLLNREALQAYCEFG
jgi:predicted DNA-binding transcriptional regulator YafY